MIWGFSTKFVIKKKELTLSQLLRIVYYNSSHVEKNHPI